MGDEGDALTVEPEIRQIAAVLAATNPQRRGTRRDILSSAAIDVLATRGPLSVHALLLALQSDFRTTALTEPELEEALLEVKEARLVETLGGPGGEVRWKATPGAEEESGEDHNSAELVVERFRLQVQSHISASGIEMKPAQRGNAHLRLIRILAAGCARVAGGHSQGSAFLRPIAFDLDLVRAATEQVNPQSLRDDLYEMAMVAVDPDDPFGNEMVHLLVVASVLICFIKKRDLGSVPNLAGTRLLLDTQVLVHLIDDGTDEQRVVQSLIELSLRLGAQVIVAEHSIDEWGRLWDAAEHENPAMLDAHEPIGAAARLPTDNPFISQFIRAREITPSLTWNMFRGKRRGFRSLLTNLGVTIRASGNDHEDDHTLAAQMRFTMAELQKGAQRTRGEAGIACDAESSAMVARWRRKYTAPLCSAYFVGTDNLIGRAYHEVVPEDESSLAVRPVSWLMYVACLTGDDADVTQMAEVVSSAAVREGFFGVATSYTLEEVLKMSEALREDDSPMSLEDSRDAVQLNINELFREMQNATAEQRALAAAAEVMRKRNARRNERARRATQEAAAAITASEAGVDRAAQDVAEMARAKEVVEGKLTASEARNRRIKRKIRAVGIGIALLVVEIVLIGFSVIVRWGILVAVLSVAYFSIKAKDYIDSDGVESTKIVRTTVIEIILLAMAMIVRL